MARGSTASLAFALLAAFARAQDAIDPTARVAALAEESQRAAAHRDLVALGGKAVPALIAALAQRDAAFDEVLAILREIGPDAGIAVSCLLERSQQLHGRTTGRDALLTTFADLVPYRPEGQVIDERQLFDFYFFDNRDAGLLAAIQRLRERTHFAADVSVARLTAIARGYRAYRVELAVELLGRRGHGAVAALPALAELLQRPDPRVLGTEVTVPVRVKAARAILAIAPAGESAEAARAVLAVLAGAPAPRPTAVAVPARAAQRIAELIDALARAAERDAAAANLIALGSIAAPPVAAALAEPHDAAFREAALGVQRDLGPRAAVAVPQLVELLGSLPIEHTASAIRALAAAAPWSRDMVFDGFEISVGSVKLFGHPIAGTIDIDRLNEVMAACDSLRAALSCDPACDAAELGEALVDPNVSRRRVALTITRERGEAARALLPTLGDLLHAPQPKQHQARWTNGGDVQVTQIVVDDEIHRLAAQAILAAAAPDDPLVQQARAVLAAPPPDGK